MRSRGWLHPVFRAFHRGADGTWYDEAGNQVTDQGTISGLESKYQEYKAFGGSDTPGEITTTGRTHEEAGTDAPETPPSETPPDDATPTDDDPSPEDPPPDDEPGAGDDDAGSGVEFTPDPDAPVLPPRDSLVFEGFQPRPGQVDPVDDDGASGPFETDVVVRPPNQFDLFGNPGSPDAVLPGGIGPHPGGGFLGPDPGQVDPTRDSEVGPPTGGREDDPFDTGRPTELADRDDVGGPSDREQDGGNGHLRDDFQLVEDRRGFDADDIRFEHSLTSSGDEGHDRTADEGGASGGG